MHTNNNRPPTLQCKTNHHFGTVFIPLSTHNIHSENRSNSQRNRFLGDVYAETELRTIYIYYGVFYAKSANPLIFIIVNIYYI